MGPKPFGDRRCLVGDVVVADQVHVQIGGIWLSSLAETFEFGGAVASVDGSVDLAGGDVQGGEQGRDAVAQVVVRASLGSPGIIGSTGAERSRAWIWEFSSTQSTSAFSGGSSTVRRRRGPCR